MIKFSILNGKVKYVSTSQIPACWKFTETVLSVDSVLGVPGARKEGRGLGKSREVKPEEHKLNTSCLTQLTSGGLSRTLESIKSREII